ncbi:MAG: FAD:protein FMN transferase [Planctomycetaceae bacterium]
MPAENPSSSNRRDFLTGKALRRQVEQAGEHLADAITESESRSAPPVAGDTVRLQTRAMACDFAIILNPDHGEQIPVASDALETVHALERQMTVYNEESELSAINREAFSGFVSVEPKLFELLHRSKRIAEETGGAFDPTSGPLISLWKTCRQDGQIPTQEQIEATLKQTGIANIEWNPAKCTLRFKQAGVRLDLGGIGKGYALDRIASLLDDGGVNDFLLHGGHSSLLASGDHNRLGGWPIGIRNPLFPQKTWATLILRDRALASSGSGVQHFRHGGKRYGHILDPRTGWPVDGMLSVTVTAPTAAEADALSTAFFVMGLENARKYCDNRKEIGAILIPMPSHGRNLSPIVCNIREEDFFREDERQQGAC